MPLPIRDCSQRDYYHYYNNCKKSGFHLSSFTVSRADSAVDQIARLRPGAGLVEKAGVTGGQIIHTGPQGETFAFVTSEPHGCNVLLYGRPALSTQAAAWIKALEFCTVTGSSAA